MSYYYTRDHLGSVREMVDNSGTIQARYDYDPFGRLTKISGSLDSDFQYAGYYAHQPSGLNLTQFRAYDPNTAKWLSRDPLKDAEKSQGPNLYEYVKDNPVDLVDPLGLKWCSKRVRLTTFTDKDGAWKKNLGPNDIAVGNYGAGPDSPINGSLDGPNQPAYPPGSSMTVIPDSGPAFEGTVSDWGSYNIIHPNLANTSGWIDVHHPNHSDYGTIVFHTDCDCPPGSSEFAIELGF